MATATGTRFDGDLTQQPPIPDEAIAAAVAVMQSGRLHRYGAPESQTAALEGEFAAWQDARYCLALASGGQAMQIAMRAAGVAPGDRVLTNAFTLAPVPGAIVAVGAVPVLVEITPDLVLDLDDLAGKARASDARWLLLSHMRGHLCDMDRLSEWADRNGVTIIEDCAHTMGARWNGRRSGNFGVTGCFSTQSYKHLNSGEGGLLTTDDPALMARAIILSGSYMLYARHGTPPPDELFEKIRLDTPNNSARMDELRAAILRPQLRGLETNIADWNARHDRLAAALASDPRLVLPRRAGAESYVGSSIQFRAPGIAPEAFLAAATERGVDLKWFGRSAPMGFTSSHRSWRFVPMQELPRTDEVLADLYDMRVPLTLSLSDCDLIAALIREALP